MCSNLWKNNTLANVPTIGNILKEVTEDGIGVKEYDMYLAKRAQTTLLSYSIANLPHCSNRDNIVVTFIPKNTECV